MRTLLTTALLLPLLSVAIGEPGRRSQPRLRPPSFPLNIESVPAPPRSASVLLIPIAPAAEHFTVSSTENGVSFDIDGDGTPEHVAWPDVGVDIAFLAVDVDSDGRITSGKELVGPAMAPDTRNAANALIKLQRAVAGTSWSKVQAGDPLYDQLLLWIDRNHNGIGEPPELRAAREVFTAIGLGYTSVHAADARGNRIDYQGWMEVRTGGPDQPAASTPEEQRLRLRHFFETKLVVRD